MSNQQLDEVANQAQSDNLVVAKKTIDRRFHRTTILNETNFSVWKWALKYNLLALGLYDVVTTKGAGTEDQKNEAMLEIISSLDDKVKIKVAHCRDPFELYQTIESLYVNKTSFQTTALHMRLANFKFKSIDKISEGISEIQSLVAKLKNLEEQVSDHHVEGIVLAALPSSFRTFVTVWKGQSKEQRTLVNLYNQVMAEVEDNKHLNHREDKALFVNRKRNNDNRSKKSTNSSKQSGHKKFNGNCHYCKKPGHLKKDCYKRIREEGESSGVKPKEKATAMMAVEAKSASWVADSGASCHMTSRRDWLGNYEEFDEPRKIYLADHGYIMAEGSGNIKTSVGIMYNVYYVPKIATNLFSINAAADKGLEAHYGENSVTLLKHNNVMVQGIRRNGVYTFDLEIIAPREQLACVANTLSEWHRRLGHISTKVVENMAKEGIVKDLTIRGEKSAESCKDCLMNKGKSATHKSRTTVKADRAGSSLHLDTIGPMKVNSLGGSKYAVLCKDETSAFRKIAFVETKAEIPDKVKNMIVETEFETNEKVARICTDNGTEFVNKDLESFRNKRGIALEMSAPYTPQQNGYIERDIRTITESARTMLNGSNLPEVLWAEAMNTAVYVMNCTPTTVNPTITPYEMWHGAKPSVKHLRTFGDEAVVNRPLVFRDGKWDVTGDVMRFVGYTKWRNTYRFYSPEQEKVIISCNFVFLNGKHQASKEVTDEGEDEDIIVIQREEELHGEHKSNDGEMDIHLSDTESCSVQDDEVLSPEGHEENPNQTQAHGDDPTYFPMEVESDSDATEEQISTQVSTSEDARRKPVAFEIPKQLFIRDRPPQLQSTRLRSRANTFVKGKDQQANLSTVHADLDPNSFKEAMKREDAGSWKKAMQEEIESLKKNQVWTLIERPRDSNIVSNRWVLKIKRRPDGSIERYRARLVARGFSQVHGIDYDETYAPVVNMLTVRLLFAQAAVKKMKFRQFDIKTAFLYGDLDERVLMEQPEGFEDGTKKVCLLKKSLYGLKQSPRQWNRKFSDFLTSLGLTQSTYDQCVYYRSKPSKLYLAIYVDDGLIFSEDERVIQEVLNNLKSRFEVHETQSDVFLGFQIRQHQDGSISLHQESYINKILEKFNMASARSVENPSTLSKDTSEDKGEKELSTDVPFREAVGSLMYASNITRPDITYAVNKVSREVSSPKERDWSGVKRILRYLKDHEKVSLTYSKRGKDELIAYCDADFAGDPSMKSTTGYVVLYYGAPIHWKTQKQPLVALSSTEAELVSICTLVKDIVWIRMLATELGAIHESSTTIYSDNQSAIKLANDESSVQRTRHMGVRAAFVREQIQDKQIVVKHVSGEEQAADFLTKPLTTAKFVWNRNFLMSLLSVIALICIGVTGITFEKTSPLIWLPTKHFVDDGVVEYDILFSIINPCDSLRRQFNVPPRKPRNNGQAQATHGQSRVKRQQPQPSGVQMGPVVVQQGQRQNPVAAQQSPVVAQQGTGVMQQSSVTGQQVVNQQAQQQNQQSPPRVEYHDIVAGYIADECDNMWEEVFHSKVIELTSRAPRLKPKKRSTIGDIVEIASKFIAFGCVSNLITSVIDELNPNSYKNQFKDLHGNQEILKSNLEIMQDKVYGFEAQFNITREIEKGIINQVVGLTRIQREQQHQMDVLTGLLPKISWTSAFIQSRITQAASDLAIIMDEYSRGQVACRELGRLLGYDELRSLECAGTYFDSIVKINNYRMLRLKFSIRGRSDDTFVYKISAFKYWEHLTDMPTLMEYQGYKDIIYNYSSNCLKAIEEPQQEAILESCTEGNYTDSRVSIWSELAKTRDIHNYNTTCQVRRTAVYNYIYCFPFKIITNMGTFDNPSHAYRLPQRIAFELPASGFKHIPVIRKLNFSGPAELPAVDSISLGHFSSDSEALDEVKWFDKMQALIVKVEELNLEKERSISIEKHGGAFWTLISFIVLLTLTTVSLLVFKFLSDQENHRRVAYDLQELKSNYCEVKVDCKGCQSRSPHFQSSNIVNKEEKPHIEVGKDSSITINLNQARPLPEEPKYLKRGTADRLSLS